MGRFFNSFKGQLGRDTGRLLSNFVYGDKHYAPYRRVDQLRRGKKKAEVAEVDVETDDTSSSETLWSSIGKAFTGSENKEEKKLHKKIENLKGDIRVRMNELNKIQTPQEEKELVSFLLEFSSLLQSNNWASDNREEIEIRNQYADLLFHRFRQGLGVMEAMFPNNRMLPMFRKDYKSFKKQRFTKKYLIWIMFLLVVIIFLYFLFKYAR